MARTFTSDVIVREKYYWPESQIWIWMLIMLAASGTILGVFANFMMIQNQLRQPTPWIMPYGVTVGTLALLAIIIQAIFLSQRRLRPGIVMLSAFILFVLFIAGAVGTGIQLFGGNNITNQCNMFVYNERQYGPSVQTLAWLQQQSICQSWSAVFAFWIVGAVFFIWMIVIGVQVNASRYED